MTSPTLDEAVKYWNVASPEIRFQAVEMLAGKPLNQDSEEKFLTLGEAAGFARCHKRTLTRANENGKLPFYKPNGGYIKVKLSELKAYMEGSRVVGHSQSNRITTNHKITCKENN